LLGVVADIYERISIENRRFCTNWVSMSGILGRPSPAIFPIIFAVDYFMF